MVHTVKISTQGNAGLDWLIEQSVLQNLQSILLDCIVIDNPILKSGLVFGLSIQQLQFNPIQKKIFLFLSLNCIAIFNAKQKTPGT